jgi:hypothetical protein
MSRRRITRSSWPSLNYERQAELDWLLDRGVRLDHKGRIIVSLPSPDDDLDVPSEDDEATISQLMRREVDRSHGGSRGRRRREPPKISHQSASARTDHLKAARLGRPALGEEPRVYVQTTIAAQTRETLAKHHMTLATVFDECARGLSDDG